MLNINEQMRSLKDLIQSVANIKLALHLDGKLRKILRLIVCDGNVFQAKIFEFAPKNRRVS